MLFSGQRPPRREADCSVMIDVDNVRAFLRARYFLAGLLIGAVILVPVFVVMG
jgi:hypothetical protein